MRQTSIDCAQPVQPNWTESDSSGPQVLVSDRTSHDSAIDRGMLEKSVYPTLRVDVLGVER